MFIWDIYYADKNDVNMFFPKSISGVIQSEWYYARLFTSGKRGNARFHGNGRENACVDDRRTIYDQNCIQSSKKYTKVIDKSISTNAMNQYTAQVVLGRGDNRATFNFLPELFSEGSKAVK